MRKKKLLNLSAILLGALMCFSFNKVEASTSVFDTINLTRSNLQAVAQANSINQEKYLGISKNRESGDYYQWNMNTTGEGKTVWKIATYSSLSSDDRNYSDLYYCLNAVRGFGISNGNMAEGSIDAYKNRLDMKISGSKDTILDYAGANLETNYNKILWILDNSYIPTGSNNYKETNEYKNLMNNAGIEIENKDWDLTEDDIEVVQQMAIWYFTNYDNVNYSNSELPSLYINGRQLSSIYYGTDEYGEQITGAEKQRKANKLYKYFINNADANYSTTIPSLSLNNTNATVEEDGNYYIAGPFKLTGTDTEKITEIISTVNKNFTLLNSTKQVVSSNEFSKVIGDNGFYLRFEKSDITENTTIILNIEYKYNTRILTFMTDAADPTNTQPVVLVKNEEQSEKINTDITINLTQISVEKVWDDNENQDGIRPASVTVQLYRDGNEYGNAVTLNSVKDWKYEWTGLLSGHTYTVQELNVPTEYEEEVSGSMTEGFKITNKHTPEMINIEGTKTWEDSNNQDRKRPEQITIKLYANTELKETKVVTAPWTYKFENLPKYNNGEEITYTIDEETVEGYTKKINGYNITNKYEPGKVSKTVVKNWNDNENSDKSRPEEVIVQLYKRNSDGTEIAIGTSQKLNAENNWSYTWSGLDENENGNKIIYLVKEKDVEGYTTTYSEETYTNTDRITITNTHTPGKYNVVLKKTDNNGIEIDGAVIEIGNHQYEVGHATVVENEKLTSDDDFTLNYILKEKTVPENYNGLSSDKNISIRVLVDKDSTNNTYKISRAYLIDENENEITDNDIIIGLDKSTNTIIINVKNQPKQLDFDLALRKFITKVNDNALQREPVVDTSTIATTGTATYKHTKEPVSVQIGDIVTYTIRVYNEGETDGYASQITDYLPEWLDFLPDDELNQKYLWEQNLENNRKITTNIASKDSETGKEIYSNRENKQLLSAYNGGNSLDYIDVEIRCKVNEKAEVKQLITNIAEISKMQDIEGIEVITDRDSTKANVNLPTDTDLPNYKGKESNKSDLADKDYYYKGQEDDDDFEKLIVENFDLALRKFIVKINDTELKNVDGSYKREPVVDTSKLYEKDENNKLITTATYNHPKNPVEVMYGDIVTYTIRIFNEGTLSGFANEIIENIPEGLEFVEDSSINKTYGWKLKDGKLVTNYLSDADINNLIKAANDSSEGNKVLNYKDVQVQFKVVANPVEYAGNIITNWAEIREDSNNDIDSIPGNDVKEEDDIDYEPVKLVYFDLSLRKFITNVNGTEINNRVPEVDTSKIGTIGENGKKITTATYTHTKDPIVLETGSIVIYTIRVYNEGSIDGYATEITDNIPEGLEFLPEDKTNTDYKWTMIDEEGNITQDVSKAKKITTNYLSKQNDSSQIIDKYDDVNKILSYKDVKVAFKVIEPNTSDRIVVNTAEISKDSNEDIDSIPGNNANGEDDIDNEYVKVETFDLSLKKWVTATKVTYDGKTKTTKTGFNENSTEMAKVDLIGSKLKKTTVKFVYNIKVTNEGEVAGYATEIKDYIPSGLKFVAKDNPDWKEQKGGVVTTDKLKDTLLEPGQSAIVEIVLTWKNSSTNMGVKTNWAEISVDSGDDVDSTPDNYNKLEDDIDDASVILSIKTGSVTMYITLTLISISILAGGTFLIKKYVIDK